MEKKETIIKLVNEILKDIESNEISGERILLKTKKLLRLRPDKSNSIEKWINFELKGYNRLDSISLEYMTKTNRWINRLEKKGYLQTLSEIEATIETFKIRIKKTANTNSTTLANLGKIISTFTGIRSRVMVILDEYITEVYCTLTFENTIDSIFETYKQQIDKSIITEANDVIVMLPSVMDRLQEKDSESISQALSSCRRIIDTFADFVYPPSDEKAKIGEQELEVKKGNVKNRINAYVDSKIDSTTRKKRLRQNLKNLYDRVCTGIHSDVSTEEAKALIFNTYLLIGEILNLEDDVAVDIS